MIMSFSRFDAVASRRRAPVVRPVRENILQKRVLLGAEIKMRRSPFRPPLRVWRWEMRRNARSCTRRRDAGSAASQVVAKNPGAVAPSKHTSSCNISAMIQPVRANSAKFPGHPVILCICTRLAFHLWVFSLPICYILLGRSAVVRVLKYVRNQKDPFFFWSCCVAVCTKKRIRRSINC